MKRIKFLLMTATLAVLMAGVAMFTGCNKEEETKKDGTEQTDNAKKGDESKSDKENGKQDGDESQQSGKDKPSDNDTPETLSIAIGNTQATSVGQYTANLSCRITKANGQNLTQAELNTIPRAGFCLVEGTGTPTTNNTTINRIQSALQGNGSMSGTFNHLKASTTYSVRAWCTLEGSTTYGDKVTFTTKDTPTPNADGVYVLNDYLTVYPEDLGTFNAEPTTLIKNLNKQMKYGYGTWRLPTNEEVSIMRSNKLIGEATYMTQTNTNGIVRLVTDNAKGRSVYDGYVDLGLPSGLYWKEQNESGCYSYSYAVSTFGSKLPTKAQFEELKNKCSWQWTGSGYKVTGPNGNSITLPAAGYRTGGHTYGVGSRGSYWSSTPIGSDRAWYLDFDSSGVSMLASYRFNGKSVRLVQD